MDIQWHGLSCFSIKGKSATVATDPFDESLAGFKLPKISADIVCANADLPLHHNLANFGKDAAIFDWPGEYEAKGVIVQGIPAYDRPREKEDEAARDLQSFPKRVIIFTIEVDGFKICHLSNLGHKLTTEMLENIGDVDILLIPVGGKDCLDAKKAHEVIEQIDPRVVIPMYYNVADAEFPLQDVAAFLKEMGIHAPACEKVLKFSSPTALPQEHTEFKILEPAF